MAAVTKKFRAEMKQLMDIIIHSLYSNKEIFLRELISNAADAIDKARFLALTQPAISEATPNEDRAARRQNGRDADGHRQRHRHVARVDRRSVGRHRQIRRAEFLENLKAAGAENRPELIGQFGVGFYSAFMVADKVTVEFAAGRDPENGVRWTPPARAPTRSRKRGRKSAARASRCT